MRSPITRPVTPDLIRGPAFLRQQQDEWDLFAKIRALRRAGRDRGEPPLFVAASMVFGIFALIPFIAAMLP